MNTLILYDSTFGHTGQIALIIAGRLGDYGTVKLFRIHEAGIPHMENMDMVILGCPTFAQGPSEAMQTFLERLPQGIFQQRSAATFDTCYDVLAQPFDQASFHLARKVQQKGAILLLPPKSFFVIDREVALEEQDVRDATHWAEQIAQTFEAQKATVKSA